MIILGIDPGIATTGFAITEQVGNRYSAKDYGVITTPANLPLPKRIHLLATELEQIITKYQPTGMAIEDLFFSRNAKTALIVSQARGAMLLIAEQQNVPIFQYKPNEVKLAVCGYGKADKTQVQKMTKSLLNLDTIPKPDDAADALAISICHFQSYRLKSLV